MFDFHEKRKIRRILYSKISIGVLFFLALVLGKSAYERFVVEREMAAKLNDRAEELEALTLRAVHLETQVDHLLDDRGIEEELRTRFDAVKEGEHIVILLKEEGTTSPSLRTQEEKDTESPSLFEKLRFW